ncbi:hypothetical protein TWF696_003896 [Orbilia brochopaga]|uniref:Survival protein SurE-like phosphatase/nucleotidase domain-containing protein n=1 Tax=Orbilia brochopaga TaxID=3140254 RepID=A0AAV9V7I1_9PEZI
MHILLTNDDGPPGPASPYITYLVDALRARSHTVSVCIPADQKSWIGKAHIIGHHPHPTFYRPDTDSVHDTPREDGGDEWVLINGTPASCTQIGLFHIFRERPPIDLVISGPNFGKNTSAVYALSSGTMGGAMEAALSGGKAISVSYAYRSRNHDHNPAHITAVSTLSARIIDHLYANWPTDGSVDMYSVNLPVDTDVENTKILFTHILQNTWGGCYAAVRTAADEEDPNALEMATRDREGAADASGTPPLRKANGEDVSKVMEKYKFRWAPRFSDVEKTAAQPSAEGSDAWALRQGYVSVTPLKANFLHGPGIGQELILPPSQTMQAPSKDAKTETDPLYAIVDYTDDKSYVEPLILTAIKSHLPHATILPPSDASTLPHTARQLHWTAYESLDFTHLLSHPTTALFNAYVIRKALIRKHYLLHTVDAHVRKHPSSVLKAAVPTAVAFEVDYAEFLDEALQEAYELTESLDANDEKEPRDRQWWILKPGMSDRGAGIRLFSTLSELQAIFESWEEDSDEEEEEEADTDEQPRYSDGIVTSRLRHFVAQEYIPPILLTPHDGTAPRKFHIRTYILAVGALTVYVYRPMLALFAAQPYSHPGHTSSPGTFDATTADLSAHLTNTCLQSGAHDGAVLPFWSLPTTHAVETGTLNSWFDEICRITGELFRAAVGGGRVHFQPVPNGFEIFGVDFLIGEDGGVGLLEVNVFPDFKQTGEELSSLVGGLFEEVVGVAAQGFFGGGEGGSGRLVKVLEMEVGGF